MENIAKRIKYLNDNVNILTLLLTALPIVWAIWNYLRIKTDEIRQRNYETYHELIQTFVEGKSIDRQIAIVFDLNRLEQYYPVTLRILEGFLAEKLTNRTEPSAQRLIAEINISLANMKSKLEDKRRARY